MKRIVISNTLLCGMTLASIEKIFTNDLKDMYGPDEAASIAWLVIGFICRINRTQYLNSKNNDLSDQELSAFYKILTELKEGIPVQYALGETEFYGSVFKVDPSVLIPRPETEELVDWILKDIKALKYQKEGLRILDIGTGSGCISITLKKYIPYADVSAIDVSPEALKKARENALFNEAEITLIQDDILHPATSNEPYTIIVSNPPYVTSGEKDQMHSNVLAHEPHTALFVPDNDPLVFYRAIADFARSNLQPKGALYLEINESLGAETISLLKDKGFKDAVLKKDLRDRDRMIRAHLN